MNIRLLIVIPGAEKSEQTFHPSERAAAAHLKERMEPTQMSLKGPGKLPPGAKWTITRAEEKLLAEGNII